MKSVTACYLTAVFIALALAPLEAQSVFNNNAGDSDWNTATNWTPTGVPSAGTNVQIGTQPSNDFIFIDAGAPSVISSITYNNTLTGATQLLGNNGADSLQVNGTIANAS